MKNEELLSLIRTLRFHDDSIALSNALHAVVELHQPTPEGRYPNLLCQGCSMTEVNLYANYPCLTIQAIEKELK